MGSPKFSVGQENSATVATVAEVTIDVSAKTSYPVSQIGIASQHYYFNLASMFAKVH